MSTGKQSKRATVIVVGFAVTWLASSAVIARDNPIWFGLSGAQEVPVVLTEATGWAGAQVREDEDTIVVRINFENLAGDITQAHLHLGQPNVNGGIAAWICGEPFGPSAADAPAGAATCEGSSGIVTIFIFEDDVLEIPSQGLDAGDLPALIDAVRNGNTYVNVHSDRFELGELRGQVQRRRGNSPPDLADRVDALEDHSHKYLTGRGKGHNNTRATTSRPDL